MSRSLYVRWVLPTGALVLVGGITLLVHSALSRQEVVQDAVALTPARAVVGREQIPASVAVRSQIWKQMIDVNFAGDAACVECHPRESEAHQRSGHSHTAILMADSELAKRLADQESFADPLRKQNIRFKLQNDRFTVQDVTSRTDSIKLPVTWLLGSGTHAQTPVVVDQNLQRGIELRWSFLAASDAVGVTPDQERSKEFRTNTVECFGRPMDEADIRSCIGCHSTVTAPPELPFLNSLVVENVGCERCHGPRKKHVVLAHQGQAAKAKPMISLDDPVVYLKLCSGCHRDESSVAADASPHELPRFQPYGLKRSACFKRSSKSMTCSTCHDPHDAVSHDRAQYIANCKSCHDPLADVPRQCPQPVDGDCINCHMPKTQWTAGIGFHDHWIRVFKDDSKNVQTLRNENTSK